MQARKFLISLIQILEVIGIDKDIVIQALESDMPDFEDAIQVFASKMNSIDLVITRNVPDFELSGLKVMTPQVFIQELDILY